METLDELRQEPHWSYSALNTYLNICQAQFMYRYVEHAECETIGIAHGDCPEDAEALIALLNRNHPPKNIINACYEPMTGAHVGPGALALFFYGKKEFRSATK